MINRFNANDADQCFGPDFIAVDPGSDGACIVVANRMPVEILPSALDVNMIADAMTRHGLSVMLIERQFVRLNPASALELAWRTGMMLGAVAQEIGDLDLVEVYPSTWQSEQRRRFSIKEKLNRKQGIQLSITAAEVVLEPLWESQIRGLKKPVIEGVASAWGIASWWLGLQADSPLAS